MYKRNIMNITIFHSNKKAPWIDVDTTILNSIGNTKVFYVSKTLDLELFKASFSAINESDIVIFWFASFRFYLLWLAAKFLRKKTIIIAGGFDVSSLPSIKYGAFQENWISRFLRLLMFYFTDRVIGVSHSNLCEIKQNLILKIQPAFIYLGFFSNNLATLIPYQERPLRVTMIANIPDEQTSLLKGFNIFIEMARKLSHVEFVHVGEVNVEISHLPTNIKLVGSINYASKEFIDILNTSRIIFQHSMIESFCAAVVDGALMGCLPLVSDRFSLPEIVGEDGLVARFGDMEQIENLILENINKPYSCEAKRASFAQRFSIEKRKEGLLKILKSI